VDDAGAFWDSHSLGDYDKSTKVTEMDFALTKRIRYIAVPEAVYQRISLRAQEKKKSVRDLVLALGR
jgi:hypothetical protein